jgi:hypothetical protein
MLLVFAALFSLAGISPARAGVIITPATSNVCRALLLPPQTLASAATELMAKVATRFLAEPELAEAARLTLDLMHELEQGRAVVAVSPSQVAPFALRARERGRIELTMSISATETLADAVADRAHIVRMTTGAGLDATLAVSWVNAIAGLHIERAIARGELPETHDNLWDRLLLERRWSRAAVAKLDLVKQELDEPSPVMIARLLWPVVASARKGGDLEPVALAFGKARHTELEYSLESAIRITEARQSDAALERQIAIASGDYRRLFLAAGEAAADAVALAAAEPGPGLSASRLGRLRAAALARFHAIAGDLGRALGENRLVIVQSIKE